MKKILLACFFALGIATSAQIFVNESFESGGTTFPNFTTTNLQNYNLTGSDCAGTKALGRNLSSNSTSSGVILYTSPANASNGKKVDISIKYHQWGNTTYPGGNIKLEYSVNSTTSYTQLGTTRTFSGNVEYDCETIGGTIPEGTVPTGAVLRVRVTTTRTSGNYYALYDSFSVSQETTNPPLCSTTISLPSNGVNPNNNPTMSWAGSVGATSYKVYLSTTSFEYADIEENDMEPVANTGSLSYTLTGLASNTTYHAMVVPTNDKGDATGCNRSSFTTGTADYCTSVPGNSGFADGITRVKLQGESVNIDNQTTSNAGNEYTDYSATVPAADIRRGNSYPIEVYVNTDGNYTQYQTVWIDWNQDKIFSANEMYDLGKAANVSNGISDLCPLQITVPQDAILGETRMRVRSFYTLAYSTDACKNNDDGEVEDYALNILLDCPIVTNPTNGATGVDPQGNITWNAVQGVTGYKVYLGTASGLYDIENGTAVTGTSHSYALGTSTTYYGKVVAVAGTVESADCEEFSFTTGTAGVTDINKANISLYPNPFVDIVKISDVKGVKSISVSDMSGRQVKTLEPSTELNLSGLKSGVYIINLQMEDGTVKSIKSIKK